MFKSSFKLLKYFYLPILPLSPAFDVHFLANSFSAYPKDYICIHKLYPCFPGLPFFGSSFVLIYKTVYSSSRFASVLVTSFLLVLCLSNIFLWASLLAFVSQRMPATENFAWLCQLEIVSPQGKNLPRILYALLHFESLFDHGSPMFSMLRHFSRLRSSLLSITQILQLCIIWGFLWYQLFLNGWM